MFQRMRLKVLRREEGAEPVEYAAIAAAVLIIAWVAYRALGGAVADFINNTLIPLFH